MGLDISGPTHGFRAGSYSGFNEFRNWLAQKVGFNTYSQLLDSTEEKAGEWVHSKGQSKNANKAVSCGALFHHSDCDGYITASDAKHLLKDLKAVKANLKDPDPNDTEEEWLREKLDDWIEVCEGSVEIKGSGGRIWFG
jgi:hypothetical protein